MKRTLAWLLAGVALVGCTGNIAGAPDNGTDTSASTDTSGVDGSADGVAPDTATDSGTDTPWDTATDTLGDANVDSGSDTLSDSDEGPPSDVEFDGDAPPADTGPDVPTDVDPNDPNLAFYERLKPTCEACHTAASPPPMFASFSNFMTLLVTAQDPGGTFKYVEPGDPDQSRLMNLLDPPPGEPFFMPSGKSFAAMAADGETNDNLQVADVEAWILGLEVIVPPDPNTANPPTDGVLVRRLSARHLVKAAYGALGIDEDDFWGYTTSFGYYPVVQNGQTSKFPIRSPDATPDVQNNSYDFKPSAERRWAALGGADIGDGRVANDEISPSFLQNWLQTSQAWCRIAVKKSGNTAILGSLTLSDSTASNQVGIRDQISNLHLRIIGDPASEVQKVALHQQVFEVYEAVNTEAAWTAVCSVLLRDAMFITY